MSPPNLRPFRTLLLPCLDLLMNQSTQNTHTNTYARTGVVPTGPTVETRGVHLCTWAHVLARARTHTHSVPLLTIRYCLTFVTINSVQ